MRASGATREQDEACVARRFTSGSASDTLDLGVSCHPRIVTGQRMTGQRARIPHFDDPVAVGRRLREAREAAGASQRDVQFAGCSAAYISRIERGERIPSLQVLRELGRRLDVTESWLAYGRERIDPDVALSVAEVEEAETNGSNAARAAAYRALARAAQKVAKAYASA